MGTTREGKWTHYNRALVARGDLTLCVDVEALRPRRETEGRGERGRPEVHADAMILMGLALQATFRQPLRQTQGLLASVLKLMKVLVAVPDYSTLCRRRGNVTLPAWPRSGAVIAIDSTGLQVAGPWA